MEVQRNLAVRMTDTEVRDALLDYVDKYVEQADVSKMEVVLRVSTNNNVQTFTACFAEVDEAQLKLLVAQQEEDDAALDPAKVDIAVGRINEAMALISQMQRRLEPEYYAQIDTQADTFGPLVDVVPGPNWHALETLDDRLHNALGALGD